MKSRTTKQFHRAFALLPKEIRGRARRAYRLFAKNPMHPSLRFRRVHPKEPVYSVRVSLGYRAVGAREGDQITWFWIGTHAGYEKYVG